MSRQNIGLEESCIPAVPSTLPAATGHVVRITSDRRVWVDFPGNIHGLILARLAVPDQQSIAVNAQVLMVFENGDRSLPIIIGVLADRLPKPKAETRSPAEARVDGQRVVLEGREEVVLKCGKASVTLRKDGRILIAGEDVVSTATKRQRIKGATVAIN